MTRVLKTVPEITDDTHDVTNIIVNVSNKTATIYYVRSDGQPRQAVVDIVDVLSLATPTQVTTVKVFFKRLIAAGLAVDETAVPDDTIE